MAGQSAEFQHRQFSAGNAGHWKIINPGRINSTWLPGQEPLSARRQTTLSAHPWMRSMQGKHWEESMSESLQGLSATITQSVTKEMLAKNIGSGTVAVFSTPALILLIEKIAVAALNGKLPAGKTTVGSGLDVTHLKGKSGVSI